MRCFWSTAVAVTLVATCSAAANTRFCTQDEKQFANKLHEQNTDPAKSCYRATNGDITTLATSRLCPLPECATWLAYMASNAPDCYYDSTNYATVYAAKNADCTGGASVSSSASLSSSSSGSDGSAAISSTTEANSSSSGSLSATSEDRDLNSTESLSSSVAGSVVGDVSRVGGSDSADSASASSEIEADVTTAPTPTPTEDLTIEDSPASGTTDSSNSTTPAPTTSASSPLSALSCFVTFIVCIAAFVVADL